MSGEIEQDCLKCGSPATVIHGQTSDAYFCHDCHIEVIRYKFRSALSKTKLFPKCFKVGEQIARVLVLIEWDSRARILLNCIKETRNQSISQKCIKMDPLVYVVHTDRSGPKIDQLKEYDGFPLNNIHLSSVFEKSQNHLDVYDSILGASTSKSVENELKRIMFDLLAWRLATKLGLNIVILSESSEVIAQKSITALWFGRSTSVNEISSILDMRHESIKLLRPFRNITDKELQCLSYPDEAVEFITSSDVMSSKFLDNVAQNGFPGIVTTILSVSSKLDVRKISDKLGNMSLCEPCLLCKKEAIDKGLCEPCHRLIGQFKKDKQSLILDALCCC